MYSRLQRTTALVDGQLTSDAAGQSAVVIVNRDAPTRHETSRRHLSASDSSSRSSASRCMLIAELRVSMLS